MRLDLLHTKMPACLSATEWAGKDASHGLQHMERLSLRLYASVSPSIDTMQIVSAGHGHWNCLPPVHAAGETAS